MFMTKVLVVGGAGYIGSHMVAILLKQGFLVTVFDNLSRGHKDACEGSHFIQGDLLDFSAINDCLAAQSFDIVFHFAGLAYVGESVEHPEQYRQHKLNRLVFSSTCSTYGEAERLPIRETDRQAPVNPYGFSKFVVERMLADYAKAYGFQSISLRYFNAAGCDPLGLLGERHEPETHLIPLVLREALRTKLGGNPKDSTLKL
jgi:UDP-glucose 4-epimerase